VFEGQQRGPRLLAARGETLHHPKQDEDDRGGRADRRVARNAPHQEGGDPHREQDRDQDLLATEPVPEVSPQHRTERTGDVGDGKAAQCHRVPNEGSGKKSRPKNSAVAVP
jgi:hypothetical protein